MSKAFRDPIHRNPLPWSAQIVGSWNTTKQSFLMSLACWRGLHCPPSLQLQCKLLWNWKFSGKQLRGKPLLAICKNSRTQLTCEHPPYGSSWDTILDLQLLTLRHRHGTFTWNLLSATSRSQLEAQNMVIKHHQALLKKRELVWNSI